MLGSECGEALAQCFRRRLASQPGGHAGLRLAQRVQARPPGLPLRRVRPGGIRTFAEQLPGCGQAGRQIALRRRIVLQAGVQLVQQRSALGEQRHTCAERAKFLFQLEHPRQRCRSHVQQPRQFGRRGRRPAPVVLRPVALPEAFGTLPIDALVLVPAGLGDALQHLRILDPLQRGETDFAEPSVHRHLAQVGLARHAGRPGQRQRLVGNQADRRDPDGGRILGARRLPQPGQRAPQSPGRLISFLVIGRAKQRAAQRLAVLDRRRWRRSLGRRRLCRRGGGPAQQLAYPVHRMAPRR
jgi:hypothetical protein